MTPEQEQALLRGLAVESKKRWQNIAGLYAALYGTVIKTYPWRPEAPKTELPSKCKTEALPEAKKKSVFRLLAQKKKLLAGLAACLLVFLMAFGIWWGIDAGSSEFPSSPATSEQDTEQPPRTEKPKISEPP